MTEIKVSSGDLAEIEFRWVHLFRRHTVPRNNELARTGAGVFTCNSRYLDFASETTRT